MIGFSNHGYEIEIAEITECLDFRDGYLQHIKTGGWAVTLYKRMSLRKVHTTSSRKDALAVAKMLFKAPKSRLDQLFKDGQKAGKK